MQLAPAAADSGHLPTRAVALVSPANAGQEFSRVGLANCAINTSQPVGTLISINFLVFDKGTPVLNATAVRTLVLGSPCATGNVAISHHMSTVLLLPSRTLLSSQSR